MIALDSLDLVDATRIVAAALAEDLAGAGDLTSNALVAERRRGRGDFVARADGVMAGAPVVELVYRTLHADVTWEWFAEGCAFRRGARLGTVEGPSGLLLTGERVALNLLQRLCGVATLTRRYVDELAGTGVTLLDTRKTTPGLRRLERYAVRVGGGHNHRMGLYDRVLIKDNHLALAGAPSEAVRTAKTQCPGISIEVEVTTVEGFLDACRAYPDWVLLDNMGLAALCRCVELRNAMPSPRPHLEASGGVTLETVRDVASTGVDAVSVGALTHAAPWVDIALEMTP
ncbi:carboxylating nicotinate-nucleotide diphosphorylase [Candidatus Fermentibacteria bacterium]|nr:carboxylating nicotinate-nucleotide diphosphorylase [Candidatus Fermentibacteria bacterium]